ncbi:MAG: energy-coupling factor transporter transmembrane component T, partial [Eubacteriales bacterium]
MNEKRLSFALFHPVPLFIYFIYMIFLTMFTWNPIILLLSLIGSVAFYILSCGWRAFLSEMRFYVPFFIIVAITNPLFSHNGATPLFFMNDNPITLESILCGVDIAIMICAVMFICKGFNKVMESDKILFLFGKTVPKISVVLSLSLRFIPLFKQKWREIKEAQTSLGYFSGKGFADKLISGARVFSALVTWSLEGAVETSMSMNARGYGLAGRRFFSVFRFRRADAALLVLSTALAALVSVGYFKGALDFSFYPRISFTGAGYLEIISYSAFA